MRQSPMSLLSILFIASNSAMALTDSYKEVPTKLRNWKITAVHTDTGGVRSCMATGAFGELTVSIGNELDPSNISFEFTKKGTPKDQNNTDERPCGPRPGKNQAPVGTWRYNTSVGANEICDGKQWRKFTDGRFKNASLLVNGKEIAKSAESSDYKLDSNGGEHVVYRYHAWFPNAPDLLDKLQSASKVSILFDDPKMKPIELGNLDLTKIASELRKCANSTK